MKNSELIKLLEKSLKQEKKTLTWFISDLKKKTIRKFNRRIFLDCFESDDPIRPDILKHVKKQADKFQEPVKKEVPSVEEYDKTKDDNLCRELNMHLKEIGKSLAWFYSDTVRTKTAISYSTFMTRLINRPLEPVVKRIISDWCFMHVNWR